MLKSASSAENAPEYANSLPSSVCKTKSYDTTRCVLTVKRAAVGLSDCIDCTDCAVDSKIFLVIFGKKHLKLLQKYVLSCKILVGL